jgi:hypothetical protein
MSEIKLGDNPSNDTQLGVLIGVINRLIVEAKEIKDTINKNSTDIGEIKFYQREQNSNVTNAVNRIAVLEESKRIHDEWHGNEDDKIAERVHKTKGRNEVLIAEWKIATALVGTGIIGALGGKLGNLLGWW